MKYMKIWETEEKNNAVNNIKFCIYFKFSEDEKCC